jgi:hypothetical protein
MFCMGNNEKLGFGGISLLLHLLSYLDKHNTRVGRLEELSYNIYSVPIEAGLQFLIR